MVLTFFSESMNNAKMEAEHQIIQHDILYHFCFIVAGMSFQNEKHSIHIEIGTYHKPITVPH